LLDSGQLWLLDRFENLLKNRPIESAENIAIKFTNIARLVDGKHRKRTLSNLELAFPEWSDEKRREVAKEVYRHFGRIIADFVQTSQRTDQEVLDSMEVIGMEHLHEAEARNNGIIAITGHFGSWERMAQWLHATGRHITVITRDANQGVLDERVKQMRKGAGMDLLSRGSAARGALIALKRNKIVGILPDQNSDEIFVPFFGKQTGYVRGPGILRQSTGSPMLTVYAFRTGPGKYRMEISPIVEPEPGYDEVEGIARALSKELEKAVRKAPEQWLWMHDRWKSARQRGIL